MSTRPDHRELNRLGFARSNRHGARITNFFLHTQEGDGTAESLAGYLNNTRNGVSYHYTLRDGVLCAVVDTDYASWSVLNANPSSINLCFAGSRAAWSRADWMKRRNDIRIAAWVAVQDAKKYSYMGRRVQGRPYPLGKTPCISDHNYVTRVLGIGTHHDVGPSFPWDVFEADVNSFLTPAPPAPVVNRINEIAARSPWLGKRLTQGEGECKDGVGRYAHFENGSVYWSPMTGARPIPKLLFEVYTELDWERGPLGYPTAFHTILPTDSMTKVGDVQAFEGGTLYRRYGQPGFYVHGVIGARWAREGFETGPLGWPVSNEYPTEDGGRRQDFDHGSLVWHPSGAIRIEGNRP